MPGLVPGIHVLLSSVTKDVDGSGTGACPSFAVLTAASRVNPTCGAKPGHDEFGTSPAMRAWMTPPLINRALALRGVEREGGNGDVEFLPRGGHHAVGSRHETRGRGERHAARVLEVLSRLEHWLFPHHARPAHLLEPPLRVGDAPVARLELDGLAAAIGQGDGVGPEEIAVL